MSTRVLTLAVAGLLALGSTTARAQTAKLTWGPAPPFLPSGARFALVSGDPGKAGPFNIQLELPDGYVIPPHWHPTDEHVTVKSGAFRYGMGDEISEKSMKTLRPGQSANMKATMHHYATAKGRTVVAVSGEGPFAITYVKASDDPRKGKPKA
jgi:quercetin dioxygenase-like cupin family protein